MTWDQSWYGTPDTISMLQVTDPGNNTLFGTDSTCMGAITDMVTAIQSSADVLVGWLWWGGGPWWGSYKFALDPVNGKDVPQMALITPFLH